MYKGILFDLDGTLLDSMHAWDHVAIEVLHQHHCICEDTLDEQVKDKTIEEAVCYLHEQYLPEQSMEQLKQETYAIVARRYQQSLNLKPGVQHCIEICHELGYLLCVVSANTKDCIESALTRCGIRPYFASILSCEDVHLDKRTPAIYWEGAKRLGLQKEACIVVEDALHAIQSAKAGGFYTIGMYEEANKKDWAMIQQSADQCFEAMKELEEFICRR